MKPIFTSLIFTLMVTASMFGQQFQQIEGEAGFGVLLNTQGVATADYDNDGDLDRSVLTQWCLSFCDHLALILLWRPWSKAQHRVSGAP